MVDRDQSARTNMQVLISHGSYHLAETTLIYPLAGSWQASIDSSQIQPLINSELLIIRDQAARPLVLTGNGHLLKVDL